MSGAGPLAGVTVLDAAPLLPGPFCAQMLADLGADVIRLEPPHGDWTRTMVSGTHAVTNRNKRSLALDLRDEAAQVALQRVAAGVDVVVEGFRPGVAQRLGMGHDQLASDNPRLVYCSISGFGQDGPARSRPGHDLVYLAAAGALGFSGHWSEAPRRSGLPTSDLATSAYAAVAVMAALHERQSTGVGCRIDLAITDVAMSMAAVRAGPGFDHDGADRLHLYPANDLFTAADGVVLAIAAVEEKFWEGLRTVVARREPAIGDPRFEDDAGRRRHGDELQGLLSAVIAAEPSSAWIVELEALDVPVQPVLGAADAAADARHRERPVIFDTDGERHVPFPALRDGRPMAVTSRPAPPLGAHNEEILRAAGIDADEIRRLSARPPLV